MNAPRLLPFVSLIAVACGGSGPHHDDMGVLDCAGAPTIGPTDDHCEGDGGLVIDDVDPSLCNATGAGDTADYGATMYGTMGRDDDCKYVVSYTVDPICENEGVSYVVTATSAKDGSPITGAATHAEVFLNDEHPAPSSGATTVESPAGTYKIGPIVFNASGRWTVRFHFFEDCADVDGSPHGHAAFYMTVP